MKSDTRFVFDTNVIISALLFNTSVPGQAFARSLDHGSILISQSLVEELNDVLGRDKFVLQRDEAGKPIHVVWGIPKGKASSAVLVTGYWPDTERWTDDCKRRRKR